MNIITNFNHSSTIISAAVQKLMSTTIKSASSFRLSVLTPDDTQPEGTGQYKFEAPVVLELLRTAYSEIVSAANRITSKDALIPMIDRHRSLSGFDDTYDGAEEKAITEEDIETLLCEAIDRAEVILRYGKHIAAVKGGGAEWLAGFEVDKWVPVEGLKDEELEVVMKACVAEIGLTDHIKMGRVKKVRSIVENRLVNFNEWCDTEIHRKGQDEAWKNKLAYARSCNIVLHDMPVNTACEYIGDIALASAFNRATTRLEDAVARVANNRYIGLAYAIQNELAVSTPNKRNIEKAQKKAYDFLPYSSMLQTDVAEVKASEEWADYQLDLDVKAAEAEAKRDERQAYREMAMFDIEKRALAVADTRKKANDIRALIAKQREELLKPQPTQAELQAAEDAKVKKAAAAKKAAETRAKNKAAKTLKGVHKASNMPVYNTTGVRH